MLNKIFNFELLRTVAAADNENTNRLSYKPQNIKWLLSSYSCFRIPPNLPSFCFCKISHEIKIIANNNIYDLFIHISTAFFLLHFQRWVPKLLESHCFRYRVRIVFKNEMKWNSSGWTRKANSSKCRLLLSECTKSWHNFKKKNSSLLYDSSSTERKNIIILVKIKSNPSLNKS